jgi:integrase/recombinase XerD
MDNLFALKKSFTEHLKVLKRSRSTITCYTESLATFFAFLGQEKVLDLREVMKETLSRYREYLGRQRTRKGKPYSIHTVHLKLKAVKRFFEYLEKSDMILMNPTSGMVFPKLSKKLPKNILTEKEAKKLLRAPNTSTRKGIRDRAILETFYSTGLRLEELHNLTIYDVDTTSGFLRVKKGKGAKDRVLPLGSLASKFIREYIKHARPHYTRKNPLERSLFVGVCGRRMNKIIIERMVRDYAKKARVRKRVTPHTLRHSFATHMIARDADIVYVQRLLGHSDARVTQRYTKVTPKDAKRTHRKHHPREKDRVRVPGAYKKRRMQGNYERA